MANSTKLIVSHAPFWHDGNRISSRSYNLMIAALPAVLFGIYQFGIPAAGVAALSVSTAMIWEYIFDRLAKRPIHIGDGSSAAIGLVLAMMLPATVPWWVVITGTLVTILIGKIIYGGIGGNPFNPVLLGIAILTISWPDFLDFNNMLTNYEVGFSAVYPLTALKFYGPQAVADLSPMDLLMGQQMGALGCTFGLGIILGGLYLIVRGIIRWEISLSFLAGVFVTALLFNMFGPEQYMTPAFHLVTGYTLLGAFFLATEDSSSPVNFLPMILYGLGAGAMTVLIRNIGVYVDGVVLAILLFNIANPLLDKIRPKAIGKVV